MREHMNEERAIKKLAVEYELNVDPDSKVDSISVGMQQRVEILKALFRKAKILILFQRSESIKSGV